MPDTLETVDPRGLIRESYRIEGITLVECRSIFLDWAISVPGDEDNTLHVQSLIDHYAVDAPDHPMSAVLYEALEPAARTGRRGGARGRKR